jgi:hypothetical protein
VNWSTTFVYLEALALLGLAWAAKGARSPTPFREVVAALSHLLFPLWRGRRRMVLVTVHTVIAVSSVAYCTHVAVAALTR